MHDALALNWPEVAGQQSSIAFWVYDTWTSLRLYSSTFNVAIKLTIILSKNFDGNKIFLK